MKYYWRNTFGILLIAIICSCNKSPLDHPEYIGSWHYGQSPDTEQDVNIQSDGTGSYYYWYGGGPVSGDGKVIITKSHVKIGTASFCILEPPTHIDSTNFAGQLVSWKMRLQDKAIFTGEIEILEVYRK